MISILQRYIAKSVMIFTLLVIFVVLGLSFFIGLLAELNDIGVGDYRFAQAMVHSLLRVPYNLYQFFPMLVLLGGMMGLGSLMTHNELVVMRTSGVSVRRIITSVLLAAIVLTLVATMLGEMIAPRANFLADRYKYSVQNAGQAVATLTGLWVHEGNNFLHIDRVIGPERLEGVTRYEFDSTHQLLATYYADGMDFQHKQWVLHDLVKTTFSRNKTVSQRYANTTWDLVLNSRVLSGGLIGPDEMSLRVLSDYIQHLVQNRLQANIFQFEFWRRIFQPLTTLVMMLLAIPFVFGAPRSITMGKRIVLGVIVGIGFYMLNAFLGQFSVVFQISPFIAASLPTLLFALIGWVLISRLG